MLHHLRVKFIHSFQFRKLTKWCDISYRVFIKFFLLVMFLRYLTLKLTNEITCRCSCHLKGIFVSVSVEYFLSWNSRWIVRYSSSEHRHTDLISIVGRSAFKHFDFFLKYRLEDNNLRGSTGLCGRFWQISSADRGPTVYRLV